MKKFYHSFLYLGIYFEAASLLIGQPLAFIANSSTVRHY